LTAALPAPPEDIRDADDGRSARGGLTGRIAFILVLSLAWAGPARAHGFAQPYDLPIPLWLYLAAAATAVAGTFVVMVAFRSAAAKRAFAEVRPGKKGIEMFLLPPRAELRDSRGIATPVQPSRGWGWFRTRVKVEDGLSPAVAVDLLRQSYEYARRMPRRRPQGRRRRV